jgi:hypothetical protein
LTKTSTALCATLLAAINALVLWPLIARTIDIEFLQGNINQRSVENLDGLACRNYDRIVHLKISVDWPHEAREQETTDYKRLVFWNDEAEYLFPKGSYVWLHGEYVISGYFIPRRGGVHQGIISIAFERIDEHRLVNSSVNEIKAKGPAC